MFVWADVDECVETPDICGLGNICENLPGSYICAIVDYSIGLRKNEEGICIGKWNKRSYTVI